MGGFARFLIGLLLVPACWSVSAALYDMIAATGRISVTSLSFLGGVLGFCVFWLTFPKLVKTYVLGHELTHALWGLLFGARPTKLRVGKNGGSVNLTKSNMIITLAPYFFPFYTFVVIVLALVTGLFVSPLPCLPVWVFLIGFTWAFHVLFTLDTLRLSQPDVREYGRVFSWPLIYIANVLFVYLGVSVAVMIGWRLFFSVLAYRLYEGYSLCIHM